jgi:hypothetical protein
MWAALYVLLAWLLIGAMFFIGIPVTVMYIVSRRRARRE